MPCLCKNKVDRLQDKVLCILCKQFMHAKCYNIKSSDIGLIKNTFKCKSCVQLRRASLTTTPVHVTVPVIDINNAVDVLESDDANIMSVEDGANARVALAGDEAKIIDINLLYAELCAFRRDNEELKNQMSKLMKVNTKLLSKVDNLELLVQTKQCSCYSSNKKKVLRKSSSLSNVLSDNYNCVASSAVDRALSKPVSSSLPFIDLTNTDIASKSSISYSSVAKLASATNSNNTVMGSTAAMRVNEIKK